MPLVLERKIGQSFLIAQGIKVTVKAVHGRRVKIQVDADPAIKIVREELLAIHGGQDGGPQPFHKENMMAKKPKPLSESQRLFCLLVRARWGGVATRLFGHTHPLVRWFTRKTLVAADHESAPGQARLLLEADRQAADQMVEGK